MSPSIFNESPSQGVASQDADYSYYINRNNNLNHFLNALEQMKSIGISESDPKFLADNGSSGSNKNITDIDMINGTVDDNTTTTTTTTTTNNTDTTTNITPMEINKVDDYQLQQDQYTLFKDQVEAFKYLSRNLPVPVNTLYKMSSALNNDSEFIGDLKFHPKGSIKLDNLTPPNPDIPETYKGLYEAVQSIHEREDRINTKIQYRLEELKELPSNIQPELKTRSLIEMKQLKVLNVQKKVRNDIVNELSEDYFVNSVQEVDMFVKPIPRSNISKPSEIMYEVTTQQQLPDGVFTVANKKKFLAAIFAHHKEFKEFHSKREKSTKSTMKFLTKYHKECERREAEKLRRLRIELLKKQDTAGYRDLLAKTKNERLEMLLSQTDSLLGKIDFLVQKEKIEQEERAERERERREKEAELAAEKAGEQPKPTIVEQPTATDETKAGETNPAAPTTTTTTTTTTTVIHKRKGAYNEETISTQPEIMTGGKLKEYQITGLQWLVNLFNNKLNGILADEMGLGKTVQTIALVCHLYEKKILEPYLIVAPLSTISNWESEFHRWAPKIPVIVYRGKPDERRLLAKRIPRNGFIVIITSFEYILSDKLILGRVPWCYVIVDEGHRIKNKNSKLSVQLRMYHSKHRLLLTGTPLQNDLTELWSLLNFLLPTIFNSAETFEQWFNAPFAATTNRGKKGPVEIAVNEEESLIIINRLHQVLRYFLLRRLKKDVESQLPEKKERIIKCSLSAMQIVMYRYIVEHGVLPLDPDSEMYKKSRTKSRGFNNIVKQLQKVCNHPYLFMTEWDINDDIIRSSGKFDMMDQILVKMHASGHRVLIFTQMTEVINLMVEYFAMREWEFLRLDGSTKPEERSRLVVEWNRKDSPFFIFVLSTHAGGLGMNLQTADTVIIFDSDWNPQMDLQAQDRCHRVGQVNRVNVFRLISANSIEERILERATDKLDLDAKIIQAGMFNTHSNDTERRAKLEEFLHGFPSNTNDEPVVDLEEINRLISRDDVELEEFNAMDAADKIKFEKKSPKKKAKPRLMSEDELPEWILRNPVEVEETNLGARKRISLNNAPIDDLTEMQFSKMVDKGMTLAEYKEYLANKKKKNKLRKLRRKNGEEEEEEEEPEEDWKPKRGRGRPPKNPPKRVREEPKADEEEGEANGLEENGVVATTTPTRGRKKQKPDSSPAPPTPATPKSGARRGRKPKVQVEAKPEEEEEEEENGHVDMTDDQPVQPIVEASTTASRTRRKLTFTIGGKTVAEPTTPVNGNHAPQEVEGTPYKPRRASTGKRPASAPPTPKEDPSPLTSPTSTTTTTTTTTTNQGIEAKFTHVWERIKRNKERNGRKTSELFWSQPSREDYPEYYEEIKNPISMQEIQSNKYDSTDQFIQDWRLMFNNALAFNDPSSQVYKDAVNLYNIFSTEMKDQFEDLDVPPLSKI
eukprot:gene14775-17464_t